MATPPSSESATEGPAAVDLTTAAFSRALLALDVQDHGPRIFATVKDLLHRFALPMVVVHVVFTSTSTAGNASDGEPANAEETGIKESLRAAVARGLGPQGETVPIRILHGDPGERICEYAEYADCDLIILEGRAKTGIAKRLRGSVGRYVAGNSRRSVLLVGE